MNKKEISKPKIKVEDDRTGLEIATLKRAFLDNLYYLQGRIPEVATKNDYYMALAYTIRDRLLHRWLHTSKIYIEKNIRTISYLSAEYLIGPQLGKHLVNLGLFKKVKQAMAELGLHLHDLLEQEEEPGLGNGGLGRLAACFMDSLATLDIPATGYGIRYEFGIFDQEIKDGWQVEVSDKWLKNGNPWEIPRLELSQHVKFGGHTETYHEKNGNSRVFWLPDKIVKAVPYDIPVLGYETNSVMILRLWKAEAYESFDFQSFNEGDYYGAVEEKMVSENITKVLYPNDQQITGKQLRLEQQYFFTSASLLDIIRLHKLMGNPLENLHEKNAIQLNDTHPSIAVAEMMHLLVDIHKMDWDKAWEITQKTISYTNHTLLPEALEKWSMGLFAYLLPRHLEIILDINYYFLKEVRSKFPGDEEKVKRMSIIDESGEKFVRMAHLAVVGSHAVNGVAKLHSNLLKTGIMKDFYDLWPEKFKNITNGVTPRRWIVLRNRELTSLITRKIGKKWIKDLDELKKLEPFLEDEKFQEAWWKCKHEMKILLAKYIRSNLKIDVNPDSMFDILVKRIHEYKRQHLKVLHIITLYNRIKENPNLEIVPRTFLFGGKAAPGYYMAKLIIKLINSVGDVVNSDPDIKDRLKVVFLPDFNVKNSQRVYPAADLSEQISMAGKEASGTGNMKFTMNGALTIGTFDGANIEIREEVGKENFFLFGLKAEEVQKLKAEGYNPYQYYNSNPELKKAIDMISSGYFSKHDPDLFQPLVDSLIYHDEYMLFADYQSYLDCQERVDKAFIDQERWTKMSILNVARCGKFSSDRTIKEYCDMIWDVKPVKVKLPAYHPADSEKVKLEFKDWNIL